MNCQGTNKTSNHMSMVFGKRCLQSKNIIEFLQSKNRNNSEQIINEKSRIYFKNHLRKTCRRGEKNSDFMFYKKRIFFFFFYKFYRHIIRLCIQYNKYIYCYYSRTSINEANRTLTNTIYIQNIYTRT